jgi:hypothetical protein
VEGADPLKIRCQLGRSARRGVGWAGRLTVLPGLVVSSWCPLGWSSYGVGWAGHPLLAVYSRLVVSPRCRLGWSSHRCVGWAGRLVTLSAGLVVSWCRLGWLSRRRVGWAGCLAGVLAGLVVSRSGHCNLTEQCLAHKFINTQDTR